MSKRQQLEALRKTARSVYQSMQYADGRAYHAEMRRYRALTAQINVLEKEIDEETRKADLAKIHIAKKALGLDDDIYRAIIKRVTLGKAESAGDLSEHQRTALLKEFGRLGWKPSRRKYSPQTYHKKKHQKTVIDKIRALWIQMHQEGITESGDEKALGSYCHRMANRHSPDWLTDKEQRLVLESLKQWRKRQWAQWYGEDLEQIHRVTQTEDGITDDRIKQMIDDGLIRYHLQFAELGIEPPKP